MVVDPASDPGDRRNEGNVGNEHRQLCNSRSPPPPSTHEKHHARSTMFRAIVALGLATLASASNSCTNYGDPARCINQDVPEGEHTCQFCSDVLHHQGRTCGFGCQLAQNNYGCSNSFFSGACLTGWKGDGLMPDDPNHHEYSDAPPAPPPPQNFSCTGRPTNPADGVYDASTGTVSCFDSSCSPRGCPNCPDGCTVSAPTATAAASLAPVSSQGYPGPALPLTWCLVAVVAVGAFVRRRRAERRNAGRAHADSERMALATSDDQDSAAIVAAI